MEELAKLYKCTGVPPWRWNTSHLPYPGDRLQGDTFTEQLSRSRVHLAAFAVTSLVAVFGNSLVIWLIRSNRSFYTPTINLYIMNLAVSDFMTGGFPLWMHFVRKIGGSNMIFLTIVCKMRRCIQNTTLNASSFTLLAIAADRFLAVKYPLKFKTMEKQHWKVIICIWTLSAVIGLPWGIYLKEVALEWKDHRKTMCVEDWPRVAVVKEDGQPCYSLSYWKSVTHTVNVVARFFLPCALMTILYVCIGVIIWRSPIPGEQHALQVKSSTRSQNHIRRLRVLRTAVMVMLAFCICWSPLHCLNVYALWIHRTYLRDSKPPPWFPQARFYCYCLAFSNSAINPILYGGLTPEFRKVLMLRAKYILCWWRNRRSRPPMDQPLSLMCHGMGKSAEDGLNLEGVERSMGYECNDVFGINGCSDGFQSADLQFTKITSAGLGIESRISLQRAGTLDILSLGRRSASNTTARELIQSSCQLHDSSLSLPLHAYKTRMLHLHRELQQGKKQNGSLLENGVFTLELTEESSVTVNRIRRASI